MCIKWFSPLSSSNSILNNLHIKYANQNYITKKSYQYTKSCQKPEVDIYNTKSTIAWLIRYIVTSTTFCLHRRLTLLSRSLSMAVIPLLGNLSTDLEIWICLGKVWGNRIFWGHWIGFQWYSIYSSTCDCSIHYLCNCITPHRCHCLLVAYGPESKHA